jgi:outer membrane protein assembly factor BamB
MMSVNAACGGYRPIPEFDAGPQREPVAIAGTPLTRLWESRPVRGPSAPVALDSLNAYLGGTDRRLAAVDLASGKTRWVRRLTGPLIGGVLMADRVLYVATDRPDGRLYAILALSGSEHWSVRTGEVEAPVALVGNRLVVLNRRNQILAVDTATGKIRWRRALPSQRIGPLAMDADRVLVSSYDSLYLVRVSDGKVLLRRRAPGSITSPWLPVGQWLIAGTGDSLVVAIDPDSLRLEWKAHLDGPLLSTPAARGDTLYCVTQLGSLYRVLGGESPEVTRLRDVRWAATGAPALLGPWLLIGGSEGLLRAFRMSDGEEEWTLRLGPPFELAPLLLANGDFLALGGRGDMQRVRP